MKLLRHGEPNNEQPAVIPTGSNEVLDARPVTTDFDPNFFDQDGLGRLRTAMADGTLPTIDITGQRLGPPLKRPGKIVCIGLNYRSHALEGGMPVPDEPIIFMKAPNTLVGPNDDVRIPHQSTKTDWEVELGVVIGSRASYIDTPDHALEHIAGYVLSNDVSEREFQLERGGQWDKGKSCDTFNPLGPWVVTRDDIPDPQTLEMWLDIDGMREQSGHTSDMVFTVAHIVWYVSQFMVLEAGDLINTGTPAGVGMGKNPSRFLHPGQEMRLSIDGLGEQSTHTVATP
jgi:2-keto-4-pentenoate hydratase/2-oxohepta-3-ene-1,7-dioic acid hydratase in catechol pathway